MDVKKILEDDMPYFPEWLGVNPRHQAPWTDTEGEVLRELYLRGKNRYNAGVEQSVVDDIAADLGRKPSGIASAIEKRLGVPYDLIGPKQPALPPKHRYVPFHLERAKAGHPVLYNAAPAKIVTTMGDQIVIEADGRLRIVTERNSGAMMAPLCLDTAGFELYGGDEVTMRPPQQHGPDKQGVMDLLPNTQKRIVREIATPHVYYLVSDLCGLWLVPDLVPGRPEVASNHEVTVTAAPKTRTIYLNVSKVYTFHPQPSEEAALAQAKASAPGEFIVVAHPIVLPA